MPIPSSRGFPPVLDCQARLEHVGKAGASAAFLYDCFPRGRVFCVIREQRDMMLSAYFRYLKSGGTDSIDDYMRRRYDGRRPGFSPEHLRYVDLIDYYQKLFSPENVLVLPFEQFKDNPIEFISDLGRFSGANIGLDGLNFEKSHNKGRNRVIESRFRFLNVFGSNSSVNGYSPLYNSHAKHPILRFKRLCSYLVSENRHKRFVSELEGKIDAYVEDMYEESNHRLSELIGKDLSKYGYHQ